MLPEPRLELVFSSVVRTASRPIEVTTRRATSWSASSCMVHRARPLGGFEHANWTSSASCAPSNLRYWRLGDGFRARTASNPSTTSNRRVRSTVRTPTSNASAIFASAQAGPDSPSSAFNRMWARLRIVLDPKPRSTNSCNRPRSELSSRTTNFAFRSMTALLGRLSETIARYPSI